MIVIHIYTLTEKQYYSNKRIDLSEFQQYIYLEKLNLFHGASFFQEPQLTLLMKIENHLL